MFGAINDLITSSMDYVFGWILFLPRDVQIFLVAILTSAVMVFARIWTTDQEWLGRADTDKRRLGELIKQARLARDKEAKKRHKDTVNLIKFKSMRYEGKPLLWAIVPVILLAVWCFNRLGFQPPAIGQDVTVRLYVPSSAIGNYSHMLLSEGDGLTVDNPVQEIVPDKPIQHETRWDKYVNGWAGSHLWFSYPIPWAGQPELGGVAEWKVKASGEGDQSHTLRFVYEGRTFEKAFRAGGRYHPSMFEFFDDEAVQGAEIVMEPNRLFGVVGGLDWLFLPPWLLAYIVIAIPFVFILKSVFHIY